MTYKKGLVVFFLFSAVAAAILAGVTAYFSYLPNLWGMYGVGCLIGFLVVNLIWLAKNTWG